MKKLIKKHIPKLTITLITSLALTLNIRTLYTLEPEILSIKASSTILHLTTLEGDLTPNKFFSKDGQPTSIDTGKLEAFQNVGKTEETIIPLTKNTLSNTTDTTQKQSLSRGGSISGGSENPTKNLPKYGELLDWWNDAQYILQIGSSAQVIDMSTGKSFYIKRTYGTNHADVETLTLADTEIMKSIWGGFSWERRPIIVNINGRYLAASMTAMPHAGVDSVPANVVTKNRSDGFGRGVNLDAVKDNGMDGVMDIHFLNSTRHKDSKKDPQHQACILKSAGK